MPKLCSYNRKMITILILYPLGMDLAKVNNKMIIYKIQAKNTRIKA